MKTTLVCGLALVWVGALFVPSSKAAETRCGWLQNPTPANWWLVDNAGRWTISLQGGVQAAGLDKIPDLSRSQYVRTNRSYGYACACLEVATNAKTRRITRIYRVQQQPLRTCREDPALPRE